MVDGNLAADARIHLSEEARRHLNEGHAAHVGRRDKAREVSDHAAAERNNRRAAIQPKFDGTRKEFIRLREALRGLPRRNRRDLCLHACICEERCNLSGAERCDICIRDDHAMRGVSRLTNECTYLIRNAAADYD